MNIVSLFAGCGGLDLGFEKAGFNVVWANEYDKSIHKTYRLNHPDTTLNTSDIRTLSGLDIPDCGKLASEVAAEVVQVQGASIPDSVWNRLKNL